LERELGHDQRKQAAEKGIILRGKGREPVHGEGQLPFSQVTGEKMRRRTGQKESKRKRKEILRGKSPPRKTTRGMEKERENRGGLTHVDQGLKEKHMTKSGEKKEETWRGPLREKGRAEKSRGRQTTSRKKKWPSQSRGEDGKRVTTTREEGKEDQITKKGLKDAEKGRLTKETSEDRLGTSTRRTSNGTGKEV